MYYFKKGATLIFCVFYFLSSGLALTSSSGKNTGLIQSISKLSFRSNPDDWDNCIDQSVPLLKEETDSKQILNAWIELAKKHSITDPESTDRIFESILLFTDLPKSVYATIHFEYASLLYDRNEFIDSRLNYEEALKEYDLLGDKKKLVILHNDLGSIHIVLDNYSLAITHFFKGLELSRELKLKVEEAKLLNNLGALYSNSGEANKAAGCFRKSLYIKESISGNADLLTSLNNLGSALIDAGKFNEALTHLNRGYDLSVEYGENDDLGAIACNLGIVYSKLGNKERCFSWFNEAEHHFKLSGNKVWLARTILKTNQSRLAFEDPIQTRELETDMEYVKQNGSLSDISEMCFLAYAVYKKRGRINAAMSFFEEHEQIELTLKNKRKEKEQAAKEVQFEYEQKKKEFEKRTQTLLNEEMSSKERQEYISLSISGGLVLSLIIGFYLSGKAKDFRIQRDKVSEEKSYLDWRHSHLEETHKDIKDSINYARRIQSAILPFVEDVRDVFPNSFMIYKPKDVVAGDFYWIQKVGDSTLFAVADCTGHGVPGAMISVICINALNRCVREFGLKDPGEILTKSRSIIIEEFEQSKEELKDGMDIVLCRIQEHELHFAGANNPLWLNRDGKLIEYKPKKQPIGNYINKTPFVSQQIELQPDDQLYLFSDGFADQFGGKSGKKFKKSNFKRLLLSVKDSSMNEQKELLEDAFNAWKGDLEQIDDVTVMGLKV